MNVIPLSPASASMGPRFCKRGNRAQIRAHLDALMSLQWGHAFVSVETRSALRAPRGAMPRLQWGHAFVSVETSALRWSAGRLCGASMGPRFCKRGNNDNSRVSMTWTLLQWGHAFVSVETLIPRCVNGQRPLPLQWGHAFVSVETALLGHSPSAHLCFNGATLL